MPNSAFLIPEDVSSVPTYVFSGVTGLLILTILFLIKQIKERDGMIEKGQQEHKKDLKNHSERIENISTAGINAVLLNLEKKLTRLETLVVSLRKIFDAILSNLNK